MSKDAFFFRHDSNARYDTKMLKLRAKFGLEGYGFYFCLLEIMRDSSDYKINNADMDAITFELQVDFEKAQSIISFCIEVGLLNTEGNFLYSESFLNRMQLMNEAREKRAKAGKKGGQKTQENKKTEQSSSKKEALLEQSLSKEEATLKQEEEEKEKEKEEEEKKEKEQEEEKELEEEQEETNPTKKLDPYCNPLKTFLIDEYEKVFGNRPKLSAQNCNKLTELASENEDFKEILPTALIKMKNIDWNKINFTPSVQWLLKDDHFYSLLNGEYDNKEDKEAEIMKKWLEED